jgi:hypothetical protein
LLKVYCTHLAPPEQLVKSRLCTGDPFAATVHRKRIIAKVSSQSFHGKVFFHGKDFFHGKVFFHGKSISNMHAKLVSASFSLSSRVSVRFGALVQANWGLSS